MRVAIATLGCKVNQYDTAVIERLMQEQGWDQVDFSSHADAYIVNSCTVTDRADSDARRLARRARRANPDGRVIMTGCYAQTSPQKVAELDYVDYVVGLGRLPQLLAAVGGQLAERVAVADLRQADSIETLGIESFSGRTRAFVKVQEGCNLFCTFCIVPVARGKSRSVEPRKVIDEIELLAARGHREVVLTGIHLGGYGQDLEPRRDLAWLLEAIAERRPPLRVRISSIDPPELTPRLLDIVAGNDLFCHHFHVPIQSGDDGVLTRMRRKYTAAQAAHGLNLLRQRIPDVCIGTDLITGFPGESEQEFETTRRYVLEAGFSYLHVFPYSRRSATSAAKRWVELPDDVVHGRARTMRQVDGTLRSAFHERFVGQRAKVLFENRRDPESGQLKGYSDNYLPVLAEGPDSLMNQLVDVELVGRSGRHLQALRL